MIRYGSGKRLLAFCFGVVDANWITLPVFPVMCSLDMGAHGHCFWNLDKEGVLLALKKGTQKAKEGRNMWGNFWFSIAKGSEKTLDRLGKASNQLHRTLSLEQVAKFVKWDVFHNIELIFGRIMLSRR